MNNFYLDSIKKFEGFTPRAEWDYAQHTNGYGTRALHPGEVIDRSEAERRFQAEIANARALVERHAPNADEGTKAALTSLTFNAGEKWARDGLGEAVRRGDMETARSLFLEYNKAGGKVLAGLVARRAVEAEWIGATERQPSHTITAAGMLAQTGDETAPTTAGAVPQAPIVQAVASDARSAAGVEQAARGLEGIWQRSSDDPLLAALRLQLALAASARSEREEEQGERARTEWGQTTA